MVTLRREALDPEIREAVRDLPDFVFSAETVPMMRQNAVFAPVPAPDIERIDLATDPTGGVALTLLRPRGAVAPSAVLSSMVYLPAMLCGTMLGMTYFKRLDERQFSIAVNMLLIISGVSLVV